MSKIEESIEPLDESHRGWAGANNADKIHYFGDKGLTLCKRWQGNGKKSYMPWQVVDHHCKACRRKYEKLLSEKLLKSS